MLKKLSLIASMFSLAMLAAVPASADTLGFNAAGSTSLGDHFTFNGVTFTAIASGAPAGFSGPVATDNTLGTAKMVGPINFATGNETSTSSSEIDFGAGGTITVANSAFCGVGACFTGTFTSAQLLTTGAGGTMVFNGNFIAGNINPALLAALGAPGVTSVTGSLTANFGGHVGDNGSVPGDTVTGITLTVTQVPEPASMALFGSGLFGLAGLIRRRK